MRLLPLCLPTAVVALALAAPAPAASTASGTAADAAARDATRAARTITFALHDRGGGNGTLTLTRIGRTRTRIVLSTPATASNRIERIYRGRDCNDQRQIAASLIALAPLNSAGANAPVSRTIVSIPLERLTSDYVLDVRNTTERSRVAAACAHLGG